YEDRRDDSQLQVVPPTASTRFFYAQRIPNSTKSILYATAETFNATDFQAYWLVTGVAGLQWPFIFNRYHEYWPSDPGEDINYVRPLVTEAQAPDTAVQLPANESPTITWQDDPNRVPQRGQIISGGKFYTFVGPGFPAHRTLIQFFSGNHVAYERVFSWLDVS